MILTTEDHTVLWSDGNTHSHLHLTLVRSLIRRDWSMESLAF